MKKATSLKLDEWIAAASEVSSERNDPGETIEDIRARTGWGTCKARDVIKRLLDAGKARHVGFRGRARTYQLTK